MQLEINFELGRSDCNKQQERKEIYERNQNNLGCEGAFNSKKQQKKIAAVKSEDLFSLLNKQQYKCALSGEILEPTDARLDHIIPASKGGEHTKDNLQWLTYEVNRAKGNMSQEDFIKMCCQIADFQRSKIKAKNTQVDRNLLLV